jgi:sulfide:quinone oxidoreductase
MHMARDHHAVVIVGGGAAGITVAASLQRRQPGIDVAIIEPSDVHYYQPAWTLVGGGSFRFENSARPTASLMPRGTTWIRARVAGFEPEASRVVLEDGRRITYEQLVVCPGIQLDWQKVDGLEETLGQNGVCSNYSAKSVRYTWECVQGMNEGTALFTQPPMPIKCAGAPQKAMYLASDRWRRRGVLGRMDVRFMNAGPAMFGIPFFARRLDAVVAGYGAKPCFHHNLIAVDGPARRATFSVPDGQGGTREETLAFDMLHVSPPQSAPEFIKSSPLANDAGWIKVCDASLQACAAENIFALGDAVGTGNAKTAAAVRKQAPVVVTNILAQRRGEALTRSYDGYGSCPLTVSLNSVILAEFRYCGVVTPSFPVLDPGRARYVWWLVKRYGLPAMYWYYMLKGYEWDIPHREVYAQKFVAALGEA